MNTQNGGEHRVLRLILAGVSVLAAILGVYRGYLLMNRVEPETGLYILEENGILYFALLAALIVCGLIAYFPAKKAAVAYPIRSSSVPTMITSAICGVGFAEVTVRTLSGMKASGSGRVFMILEAFLGVVAALYFFTDCYDTKKGSGQKQTLLPCVPSLYLGVRTVHIFIDTTRQINASEREFTLLTMVMLMLFFVTQARYYVADRPDGGEKDTAARLSPVFYMLSLLSAALVIANSFPAMIAGIAGGSLENLPHNVLLLCLGVYAFTRAMEY